MKRILLVLLALPVILSAQANHTTVLTRNMNEGNTKTNIDSSAYTSATADTTMAYQMGDWSLAYVFLQAADTASCVVYVQTSRDGIRWGAAAAKDSLAATGDTLDLATDVTATLTLTADTAGVDTGAVYYEAGYTRAIEVYSYKTVGGTKMFSSSYATASVTDSAGGDSVYSVTWSWTAAHDAEGYRVLAYDNQAGYNYNYYLDTTVTSFTTTTWTAFHDSGSVGLPYNNGATKIIDISSLVTGAPYFRLILRFDSGATQGTSTPRYWAYLIRKNYQ